MHLKPLRSIIILLVVGTALAQVSTTPRNVNYPFSGNNESQRYSTLTQINAQNVSQLKEAWRYDLGGPAQIQNQPVVIGGHGSHLGFGRRAEGQSSRFRERVRAKGLQRLYPLATVVVKTMAGSYRADPRAHEFVSSTGHIDSSNT